MKPIRVHVTLGKDRRRNPLFSWIVAVGLAYALVYSCQQCESEPDRRVFRPPPPSIDKPTEELPPSRFAYAGESGRSQIRAVVKRGALTREEFEHLAVDLCLARPVAKRFLVAFFDSDLVFNDWDRTGTLSETDWLFWLCWVTVDPDEDGNLYAKTFKLAVDSKTGQDRTDVLREGP